MELSDQRQAAVHKGKVLAKGDTFLQSSLADVGLERVGSLDFKFLRGGKAGTLASEANTHYLAWYAGTIVMGKMVETHQMKGELANVYYDLVEIGAKLLTPDRMKNVGSQVAKGQPVYKSDDPRVAEAGTRMIFQRLRETANLAMHLKLDEVLETMEETCAD
jgi:hypothetical protein